MKFYNPLHANLHYYFHKHIFFIGDVANEVETEQIVADTDVSSLTSGATTKG